MRTGESETPPVFTLRARLLLREPGDVVGNGCVVVSGGRLAYAGRWSSRRADGPVVDFPDALITPGFINAHTHLALSFLAGQIPSCRSFTGWAVQLEGRLLRSRSAEHRRGFELGVERSLVSGVTTVGDICARWVAASWHLDGPLRKVAFLELMGLDPGRVPRTASRVSERLSELSGHERLYLGLAPHAPYSVCPGLVEEALRLARHAGFQLTMHVAESKAERRLLEDGSGELASRLRFFRLLPRDWRPPGRSPVELLADWGVLRSPALLVHCNYLSPTDVDLLARSACRVVYCPRSAHYFHVRKHPWQALRQRGVPVALGTDSLASNSSLSILDEMRFLAGRHPEVAPEELLAMGTVAGARALGLDGEVGALRPGYGADLVVWEFPSVTPAEAGEVLIWHRPSVLQSYVAGRRVWPPLG